MPDTKPPSSGGCLGKIVSLWIFVFCISLLTALWFVTKPQDLTRIGGYGPAQAGDAGSRDLKAVLQASLQHGHPLTLTEAEINRWLGRTLVARQGGILESHVSLDRVWVKLDNGLAEVVMERHIMGKPFTVSMFVMIEQTVDSSTKRTDIHRHGGPYLAAVPKPLRGGRFGSLVIPQGFLNIVAPSYNQLGELYREELDMAVNKMHSLTIEKNRLVLKPRPSEDPLQGGGNSF